MSLPKTFDHPLMQSFSLPPPIVHYFTQLSLTVLEKLLKTCKYFYCKHKIIVGEKMSMSVDGFTIGSEYLLYLLPKLTENHLLEITNQNIVIIIYSLYISHLPPLFDFSRICIPCIQQLWFSHLTLNYAEYELLTAPGSIKYMCLIQAIVKKYDKTVVPVESLLEKVPNAHTFK